MKIAIAMSGGVDSSVAAKILKDEGHEVIGLFLKLWSDPTCNIKGENKCCDYEALDDARSVAAKLGIPFYVINARDEFKKEVVDYFLDEYQKLRTPNPCVVCNDKIKFGLLLKRALEIGCDFLATGHYARIKYAGKPKPKTLNPKQISNFKSEKLEAPKGPLSEGARTYKLEAGIDKTKDQSYMLYHLNQKQLSYVLFPLGEMTKKEVRALAAKWDLPVKEKPESQEICFFGDRDYRSFLKRYLPQKYFKVGEIIDRDGNVLGEHQGLINYTIGQRRGIDQVKSEKRKAKSDNSKLKSDSDKGPLYVIGFDVEKNQLIVGEDKEVYKKEMIVTDVSWIDPKAISYKLEAENMSVKIRYRHEAVKCRIEKIEDGIKNKEIRVLFNEPQRAVTPGQSAVFYNGDEVLGGGVIK